MANSKKQTKLENEINAQIDFEKERDLYFNKRYPVELNLSQTEVSLMVALLHMSAPLLPTFRPYEIVDLIEKQVSDSLRSAA